MIALPTLHQDLVRLRREIHADPEIGLHLPRTQGRVLRALDGLPLETVCGGSLTSVTAVLRGERPGPTVLLRGDMDALPVHEAVDLPYRSRIDDVTHACGHDLHTTMLVGAAHLLAARRGELAGDVVFMFQPGEEGCDGAGRMIEEGVLTASGTHPQAAYALHVNSSTFPYGQFCTRSGPILAGGDILRIELTGQGGHGSRPDLARNPILAASAVVETLQGLVPRAVSPFETVTLSIGSFHAGNAPNVIPGTAVLEGTIRWFSRDARSALEDAVRRACDGIAAAHGASAEVTCTEYVGATVNDQDEAAFAADTVADLFGDDRSTWLDHPLSAGEDFSRVLDRVPGAFVFLGACPPDADPSQAEQNHSAFAVFDDGVLHDGARLLAELAFRRLRSS